MAFELSAERKQRLEAIVGRYPAKSAACLPALHLAQEQRGVVDDDVIAFVAGALELPTGRVQEVASFYTMYRKKLGGRFRFEVCTNLSCSLMGAEHLRDWLCKELGVKPGEVSRDGLYSVNEVECLAACGTAPALLLNDELHEGVTPETLRDLLANIRRGMGDVTVRMAVPSAPPPEPGKKGE